MTDLKGNPLAEELFDKALEMAHAFIEDIENYEPYGGAAFFFEVQRLVVRKAVSTYPKGLWDIDRKTLEVVISAAMTVGMVLERRRVEGEQLERSV